MRIEYKNPSGKIIAETPITLKKLSFIPNLSVR